MAQTADHEEPGRTPRTARGERTKQALLDAAAIEFGEKGFHETSITTITNRAGTALGSFYTYFESKEEIFRALVQFMSAEVARAAGGALEGERGVFQREQAALRSFLAFAAEHGEVYRIIDEAEFVDPAAWRSHYEKTAARICKRLEDAAEAGEIREDAGELHAWALMGMNVFLGLRYAVWDRDRQPADVAEAARDLIENGLRRRKPADS
ncbi:TetR family transcriptional regulator [Pacificimonas flava]|uniref:TetR family transcriptional regulator n=2 Tax=Pacificimonas TaxID=1960290 RepID=A0A219B4W2_9SPHN|nr:MULTISPECIES: TetR/AcrR family transcriptional regulator [Pacificimonas]MBZ6377485.1 TetR/AcrR family transcriptional regulator [Pacificimonas aurantium]OWV32818.1 TetR family transcriptional regulator [Pacificimonas flava]